jgi:anaphase-promoting complex subunit 8
MAPLPSTPTTLPPAYLHPASKDLFEAALEASEFSTFLLAKSYFDVREFDRSSYVLDKCKSAKSRFIHLYAKFMAGEKRKEECSEMVLGPLDGAATQNKEVPAILAALETIFADKEGNGLDWSEDDSFLLWLYGVVLLRQKNEEEAQGALIKSVNLYPYNWCAWQELAGTVGSLSDVCCPLLSRLSDS